MARSKTTIDKSTTKGRPKGSINRVTLALKDDLQNAGFNIVEKLVDLYKFGKFDDKDKLRIIFKIMEYTHPKLKEREVTQDGEVVETQQPVNITLGDLIKVARDEA
jgi:hypothetical protein